MSDLDRLGIQIEAEDKKASSALDSLEQSLAEISNLLKGLKIDSSMSKGLSDIATGTKDIANAIRGLRTDTIQGIGTSAKKAASGVKEAASELKSFSGAFELIEQNANDSVDAIDNVIQESRTLSDILRDSKEINFVVSDSAIENLIRIKNEYQNTIKGMETGKIEFDQSAYDNAVIGFNRASEMAKEYKLNLVDASKESQSVADSARNISTALSTIRVPNFTFVNDNSFVELNNSVNETGTALVTLEHTANAAGTALARMWDISVPNFQMGDGYSNEFVLMRGNAESAGTALVAMGQSASTALQNVRDNIIDVDGRIVELTSDAKSFQIDPGNIDQVVAKLNEMALSAEELQAVLSNSTYSDAFKVIVQDLNNAQIELASVMSRLKEFKAEGERLTSALSMAKTSDEIKAATDALSAHTTQYEAAIDESSRLLDVVDNLANKMYDLYNAGGAFSSSISNVKIEPIDFSALLSPIHGLARIAKSGVSAVIAPFKSMVNSIESMLTRLSRFWTRVMRTFTFMMVRKAITAIMSDVNNAMQSLAMFESYIGTRFQQAMSTLITDFRWVGANIVAAFAPILNAITPIIDALINKLVQAITVINQFFAALTGNKVFVRAKRVAQSYGGAVGGEVGGGAEKAAKKQKKLNEKVEEFKDYLLDFDELNVIRPDTYDDLLPDPDDYATPKPSGGGGGGAAGAPYEWEEVEIPQEIFDLIEKIKEMLGDPFLLGRTISDWLTNALESIPWNKIQKVADRVGRYLADLLNGFITPDLFSAVGHTIAEALNTALQFLNSFGEEFNWKGLGTSIAAGINRFFEDFNFSMLANTLNVWAHGLLDALIAALSKIKWRMIGEKIGEFLAKIDFKGILKKIGKAIWLAINGAFDLFSGMFNAAPLETALLSLAGIIGLLKIPAVAKFGTAIANVLGNIASFGSAIMAGHTGLALFSATAGKTSGVLYVLATAIVETMSGFNSGLGIIGSLNQGFSVISNSIPPVVKGIGGIVTAFAEFALVKNIVADIVTGTDNLALKIVELTAVVGAAAVAFGVLTGSILTGGLLAAIVGITAAVVGYNQAMQEVRTEAMAEGFNIIVESTKGAEVTMHDFIRTMQLTAQETTAGLSEITEKFKGLQNIEGDIQSAVQSIVSISGAVAQTGVATEGELKRIESSFSNLSTMVDKYITEMYDAQIAQELANVQYLQNRDLWNEAEAAASSAKIAALMKEEAAVKESVGKQVTVLEEAKNAAAELAKSEEATAEQISGAYKNVADITINGLVPALTPLGVKFGEIDDSVKQVNEAFGDLTGKMDLSAESIYNTDDLMARLKSTVGGMKDAYEPAAEAIRANIEETRKLGEAQGLTETQIANSVRVQEMQLSDLNTAYTTYLGQIGESIMTIIPDAAKALGEGWDNGEILDGFTGFKSKEEYIKAVLQEFATNVYGADGLGSMIDTALEGTGLEVETKGAEAINKGIEAMFEAGKTTMVTTADGFVMEVQSTLPGKLTDGYEGAFMQSVHNTDFTASYDALRNKMKSQLPSMDDYGETFGRNVTEATNRASNQSLANIDMSSDMAALESRMVEQAPMMDEFGTVVANNADTALTARFQELNMSQVGNDLGTSINEGVGAGLTESTGLVTDALGQNKTLYETELHTLYEWNSPSGLTVPLGESLNEGIAQGLTTSQELVNTALMETATNVRTKIDEIRTSLGTSFDGVGESVSASLSGFGTVVSSAMSKVKSSITTSMSQSRQAAVNGASNLVKSVTGQFNNLSKSASTSFAALRKTIQSGWTSIQQDTTAKWNSIISSLNNTWRNLNSTATTQFESIKRTITNAWTSIQQDATGKWQSIMSSLTQVWRNMNSNATQQFNAIKRVITQAWQSIYTDTNVKWPQIANIVRTAVTNLQNAVTTAMTAIKSSVTDTMTSVKTACDNAVTSITSLKTAFEGLSTAASGIKTGMDGLAAAINSVVKPANDASVALDNLKKKIDALPTKKTVTIEIKQSGSSEALNLRGQSFATGGFPENGLFFANSTELVGRFTNGRTAVANNEQIVAGIERGVENAVARMLVPYLSDISRSNERIADKDMGVSIDGRELVSSIDNRRRRNGWSFQTV